MFSKKKPKADPGPLLVWTEAGNSGHWDDSIVFPVLLLDRKFGLTEPDLEHLTTLKTYRSLDSGLPLADAQCVSATVLRAEPLEERSKGQG